MTALRRSSVATLFVLLGFLFAVGSSSAGPNEAYGEVVLQGLDKVTARVAPIVVPVEGETRFGTMLIRPRACFVTPPTEPPESAVFLEIRDAEAGHDGAMLFNGWMFASSPGLSALEHPVYDVWVLECRKPLLPAIPLALPPAAAPTPPTNSPARP